MSVITLPDPPRIISAATVVGKKEAQGPLGALFDYRDTSDTFGQPTFEKAESEMQHIALSLALAKRKLAPGHVDLLLAGDLINQCTGSSYGLKGFDIPYFGLYGACSTAAEGLVLSSLLLQQKAFRRIASVSSSHNCSAERQFRFPLEYGGQRTPTAQWTVTGSAAFVLCGHDTDSTADGNTNAAPLASIPAVLPGRICDQGITDAANMGAAMAPAAIDTLTRYFRETKRSPDFFDLIVTGDLGYEGHAIVHDLMEKQGLPLGDNYTDCGLLIYDRARQDVHAGGSGCGCSAVVLAACILPKLQSGEWKNVLFLGTGALMSPASVLQGLSIPGIAHLVHLTCPN